MFPGRMLLIRKDSIKKKYQNGSLASVTSRKKLAQKLHILTLYRVSHSEDLRILDLRSISIGFPTVKCTTFGRTFLRGHGSRRDVLILIFYGIFSGQKHSTREHISFQFPKRFPTQYRQPQNKKRLVTLGHRTKEMSTKQSYKVEFREITLKQCRRRIVISQILHSIFETNIPS